MKTLRWILVALPAAAGVVVASLVGLQILPDPMYYLYSAMSIAALLLGGLLSAIAGAFVLALELKDRACRRREQQLRLELGARHRRFISRLDHELKNPLMAIRAGLANIMGDTPAPDLQAVLQRIESQVLRIGQLVVDLRKLADVETRGLESAPVNIPDLLKEVIAQVREQPGLEERQIALEAPAWPLSAVTGDRDMLSLAFFNLVHNAIKFSAPDDAIRVRVSEITHFVLVEVTDNGIGVPEDDLPHLGEDLYRGQNALGLPGTGLGLALVRIIVDRHGGHWSIHNRPEKGTAAAVWLPTR